MLIQNAFGNYREILNPEHDTNPKTLLNGQVIDIDDGNADIAIGQHRRDKLVPKRWTFHWRLRRFIPPLRVGAVAIDFGFAIVMFVCFVLLGVTRSLAT